MTAPNNTLVQANFKTPKGALINAYGHDEASFDLALAIIQDRIAVFAEIEQALTGAGAVADQFKLAPTQPPATAGVPAAPADSWGAPPPASFANAATPQCAHGAMTARSGASAKGPWKGWFCPTPKGTPGQCSAQFVDRKSPDWANFPA